MGIRLQCHLPRSRQRLAHAGPAAEIGTEDQGVDEETDQPLDLQPVAPRDGRADADVGGTGPAMEQNLEGGQEEHERRHLLPPGARGETGKGSQPAGASPRDLPGRSIPPDGDGRGEPPAIAEPLPGAGASSRSHPPARCPRAIAVARRRSRRTGPAAPGAAADRLRPTRGRERRAHRGRWPSTSRRSRCGASSRGRDAPPPPAAPAPAGRGARGRGRTAGGHPPARAAPPPPRGSPPARPRGRSAGSVMPAAGRTT